MACKDCAVIDSLQNAWRALCEQYDQYPSEEIRISLNHISKIIRKVKSDFTKIKKSEEPHQISIEEWLAYI